MKLRNIDVRGTSEKKKLKKIRTVWHKPRLVKKFKSVTLWHFEMSQNVTKCHTLLNPWHKPSCILYVSISLGTPLNVWHLWRSQNVTILNLWPWSHALVFLSLFSKTDLVTFWSQMSQMVTNSNVMGTNLFLFLFRLKRFGMNEIRQNIPESELCFCFLNGVPSYFHDMYLISHFTPLDVHCNTGRFRIFFFGIDHATDIL